METEREPYRPLPKIEVVGQFRPYPTGQTPSELYLADALERQGAEVMRVGVNSKKKQERARDADVVVYAGPHRVSREDRPRTLKVFWTLDAPFAFNRADTFRRAAKECDVVFASGDWELRDRRGAAPVRIPAAVSAIDVDFDPDPIRNVAFLGTIYSPTTSIFGDQGRPGDFHLAGFTEPLFLEHLARVNLKVEKTWKQNGNLTALCRK